jgi:hypothetical protein
MEKIAFSKVKGLICSTPILQYSNTPALSSLQHSITPIFSRRFSR